MLIIYWLRFSFILTIKFLLVIDGSLPTDRMARYCVINETWAESSCFGSVTAEEVLE